MAVHGNFFDRHFTLKNKMIEIQEIERRIAAHTQLCKNHQVGPFCFCPVDVTDNFFGIAFEITDVVIQLCKRNFHNCCYAVGMMDKLGMQRYEKKNRSESNRAEK